MRRLVSTVLAVAMLAVACTDSQPDVHPTTPSETSSSTPKPTPPDSGLRSVKIPYADGIAYVLPETAAQAICQGLSPAEWRDAFGGDVGRTVVNDLVSAECVATSGAVHVAMSTQVMEINSIPASDERIAGRQVRIGGRNPMTAPAAAAALAPVGEEDVPAQQRLLAYPVLYVRASVDWPETHPDLVALIRRILISLLPRLINNGPPTPVVDSAGKLPFTPTDPVPGMVVYDLPRSVQSLVACTSLLRNDGRPLRPDQLRVNGVGECFYEGAGRVTVDVQPDVGPVLPRFMIAGHSADVTRDGVDIELLMLPTKNDRPKYIQLRLKRDYTDEAELRAWAERVATPLLRG